SHHTLQETGMTEMVQAFALAVALPRRIDEGQVARLRGRRSVRLIRPQIEFLDRDREAFGKSDANETARRDRVAFSNETDRLGRGDDLPPRPRRPRHHRLE